MSEGKNIAVSAGKTMQTTIDCLRDCPDLGHCCKRFSLSPIGKMPSANWNIKTFKGVMRQMRKRKLPFRPLELSAVNGAGEKIAEKIWWFTCPLLGKDGKCGDYENRPNTCKNFVPGNGDMLCLIQPEDKGEGKTCSNN